MLVSHIDFVGELSIASVDTPPVMEKLNLLIENREPEIMIDLYGLEKYNQLIFLNESIKSEIMIKTSESKNDTGIFYVNNSLELGEIDQELNNISVEDLANDLSAISSPFGDNLPLLSDYLRTSAILANGSNSVWIRFDAQDNVGPLGSVFINELFQVKLSSPESFGFIDTFVPLQDLIEASELKQAKIKSIGFTFDAAPEKRILQSIVFKDETYIFAMKESVNFVLKYIKKIVSHFVWYWYSRDLHTLTSGSGEAKGKSENATVADASLKQSKIWNEMSNMIFKGRHYPYWDNICNWHFYHSKYAPINILNF